MRKRPAFTLIELLVVMSIISILVSLLLPAVQRAREAARRSQCLNNMKQIGLALQNYESTYGGFPPGWVGANPGIGHDIFGKNGFGWGTFILPYLDQGNLYRQFDFNLSISDYSALPVSNSSLLKYRFPIFICPSDPNPANFVFDEYGPDEPDDAPDGDENPIVIETGPTSYLGLYGIHEFNGSDGVQCKDTGPLYQNNMTTFGSITDGASNSAIIVERTIDARDSWLGVRIRASWGGLIPYATDGLEGFLADFDPGPTGGLDPGDFSSYHTDGGGGPGGNCLMCDGRVRLISGSTDFRILQAIATIAGQETGYEF